MATLADLQALQRRRDLARVMGMQGPTGYSQGHRAAAGISALASALAGRSLDRQASDMQAEIKRDDSARLAGVLSQGVMQPGSNLAEIAQIQDPQTRQLALTMIGQQQAESRRADEVAREDRFRAEDVARENEQRATDRANEIADREDEQEHAIALAELRRAGERAEPSFIEEQSIKANKKRLEELAGSAANRAMATSKAEDFLAAFETGKAQGHLEGLDLGKGAESGSARSNMTFLPTFTDQGRFDEALDAFAEEAARAKLKAAGETRATDADVEGMKRSLFGIGKDEKVNISLLRTFIAEQNANNEEYAELQRQFGMGPAEEEKAAPTDSGPPEGTVIQNPSTGEQLILQGGQWVPLGG